MKKLYLLLLSLLFVKGTFLAQTTVFTEAPLYDGGTSNSRAPSGLSATAYLRHCSLVLATELTGISSGNTITAFGYTVNSAALSQAVAGSFTVYLQNTTDVSYNKSSTWSTLITGMSVAYAGIMTIPISATSTSVVVTLQNPFVYTGGGIYVAYDWQSTGPYDATGAVVRCNYQTLTGGTMSGWSGTGAVATLTSTSNFRPAYLWGTTNTYTNEIQVNGVSGTGRVPAMLNSPHVMQTLIKNGSNQTRTNIPVTLNVGGANAFTNTQTITTLAAGAIATVNFSAFNPVNPGLNTMTVSVPADENNSTNQIVWSQSVTCNEWGANPPAGSYTNAVGFNTGSGILAINYLSPVTSSISSLRAAVSTNTASVGNNGWGVLLSSSGAIIATTNTITITSGMLGTDLVLNFSTPQTLNANTNYLLGFAQPANSSLGYFPMGALTSPYVPQTYYSTIPLNGGTPVALTNNLGYFKIEAILTPTINLAVSNQTVTCGNPAVLQATSSTNYSWSTGATTSSISITPTLSTTYTVIATNTMGCVKSTTASVSVQPLALQAGSSASVICLGGAVTLTATGAPNYSWNTGSTAQSFTDAPTSGTVYVVTGTHSAGCVATFSVPVGVQTFTSLVTTASSGSICSGNSATLTASGAANYTWVTSAGTSTAPAISVQPTINTTYTVIGANALGCEQVKTLNVQVQHVNIGILNNVPLCSGQTASLTATGGAQYLWSTGSPFAIMVTTPSVSASYTVVVTSPENCTNQAVVNVTVNPTPTLTTLASRTVICKNETTTLTANGAGTYGWSDGTQGATVVATGTITGTQTFTVTGTSTEGCVSSSTVSFKVNTCSALDELSSQELVVYPNPTNGLLFLGGDERYTHFMIIDMKGAIVKEGNVTTNEVQMTDLPNGLYLVKATLENGTNRQVRVVKQ